MTTKEQIIELLDNLNEYQQDEVLLFILSIADHPRGESGWTVLERTKSIHLDQDMVDAIEETFPIRKTLLDD